MQSQPNRVNLFWKLAVDDLGGLRHVGLPAAAQLLEEVPNLHVTLLFFGGRDEKKAAEKSGLPLREFQRMNLALACRAGQIVFFAADTIYVHSHVVFATISLPDDLPCNGEQPYVKFRVSPEASGSVVRAALQDLGTATRIDLPEPVMLHGYIEMETGEPFPKRPQEHVRQHRQHRPAEEVQGRWVHVKKHSSIGSAVISFPSPSVRDSVLTQCASELLRRFKGVSIDLKQHHEKQFDGTRRPVPNAIFVGWQHRTTCISAVDLQVVFDEMAAPFMSSASSHDSAGLADALLRKKGVSASPPSIGTGSSVEEIKVLRLTRMARSPEVMSLLLGSPVLEGCRRRVLEAGCILMPPWANGAKLFVPLQEAEANVMLQEANVMLQDHHVLVYSPDVEILKEALAVMPCRRRPKLSHEQAMRKGKGKGKGKVKGTQRIPPDDEDQMFEVVCSFRTDSSLGVQTSYSSLVYGV